MAPREEYDIIPKDQQLPSPDKQVEEITILSTSTQRNSTKETGKQDLQSAHRSAFCGQCVCDRAMERLKSKWGWIVTFAIFVLFFITHGFIGCYGLLYVALQEEFQSGATATGWVGSLAIAVAHFAGPLSNYMVKKLGSARRVVFLGVVSCFIGLTTSSICPSIYFLFGTMGIFFGLGLNMICQPTLVLLVQYFPEKNSTRSVSAACTGITLGMLALSPIINYALETIGWRATLRYFGVGILLIGSACSIPLLPVSHKTKNMQQHLEPSKFSLLEKGDAGHDIKDKEEEIKDKPSKEDKDIRDFDLKSSKPQRSVLFSGKLWLLCGCMFFTSVAQTFYNINYVSHMKVLGVSGDESAIMITLYASGQIAGELVLSIIADKLPFNKLYIIAISSILGGAATMPIIFVSSTPWLNAISTVIGFLRAARTVLVIPILVEIFGVLNVQPITAVALIAHGMGFIVGAFVMGCTFDKTGNYDLSISICVTLLTISAFLYASFPIWRKYTSKAKLSSNPANIPLQKIEENDEPVEECQIMPMPNVVVRVREIVPALIGSPRGSQECLAAHGDISNHRFNHMPEHEHGNNYLSPGSIGNALQQKLVKSCTFLSEIGIHTPPRSPRFMKDFGKRCAQGLNESVTNHTAESHDDLQQNVDKSENT